jgi:acyl carrier protein
MEITNIVHQKILEVLERTDPLDNNVNLMEHGLDSLKTVQLIVTLEEEMDLEFDDENMLLENFETIEKIVKTVEKIKAS